MDRIKNWFRSMGSKAQCKHRYHVAKKRGKHTVTCPNCGQSRIIKH